MDFRAQRIVQNLEAIASAANAQANNAVSFKLRPTEKSEGWNDRYVYPQEYAEMVAEFGLKPDTHSRFIGGGSFKSPSNFILVEHETGPEILALIAHAGEVAAPYLAAIEIVRNLVSLAKWLHKKIKANCDGHSPDRHYHDARFIRVEMRTRKYDGELGEEIVTILDLAAPFDGRHLSDEVLPRLERRA